MVGEIVGLHQGPTWFRRVLCGEWRKFIADWTAHSGCLGGEDRLCPVKGVDKSLEARNATPTATTKQRAESQEQSNARQQLMRHCHSCTGMGEGMGGVLVGNKPLVPGLVPLGGVRFHGMGQTLGAGGLKGNCLFFGAAAVWGHSYVSLLVPTSWDSMSSHMLSLRRQLYPRIIQE